MKWFRTHIRHGARLALLTLAVQFVLSFGHFHGTGAMAASGFQPGADVSGLSLEAALNTRLAATKAIPPASDHDGDQQSGEFCDICAVMSLASTALSAMPPALLLPQAVSFSHPAPAPSSVRLSFTRAGFQARAPPLS